MRHKVVLYNPKAVFYTMPLGLLAVGSCLDAERYDVRIIDARLEDDPQAAVLAEIDDAVCLGMSVLTGRPIADALGILRAAKARRPDYPRSGAAGTLRCSQPTVWTNRVSTIRSRGKERHHSGHLWNGWSMARVLTILAA